MLSSGIRSFLFVWSFGKRYKGISRKRGEMRDETSVCSSFPPSGCSRIDSFPQKTFGFSSSFVSMVEERYQMCSFTMKREGSSGVSSSLMADLTMTTDVECRHQESPRSASLISGKSNSCNRYSASSQQNHSPEREKGSRQRFVEQFHTEQTRFVPSTFQIP